jgi:predicted DCC family thiol-disulfide oxidoreductase YuxK
MPEVPESPERSGHADEADLVLYDGVCGFCNGVVQWLLAHDTKQALTFAALQGETASALRLRHPEIPESIDTFVFVERRASGERVWLRSAAFFRVFAGLPAPWRWISALRVVPRTLTDRVYDAFVRRRYRWFGQLDSCPLPSPEVRARFLP